MGIRVSAIVSTYKAERFIASRLRNLLKMPIYVRGELEIIVIDSNSPENEQVIVERFQRSYRNIKYFRTQIRESVYQSWNRGIKHAAGKYVINANTDDLFVEPALSIMADYLDQHSNYHAVYGNWLVQENGYKPYPTSHGSSLFVYDDFFPPLLFYYQLTSHAVLIRKKTLKQIGGYDSDLIVFGDRKMMFEFATQGYQARHLEITEGVYLKNREGLDHGTDIKIKQDESYSIYDHYIYPSQLIKLWGISKDVERLPSKIVADIYALTAVLGVWKFGSNRYQYTLKKLIMLVKQALVFSPTHWLASLIFATILYENGKGHVAIQILRNAIKPKAQYWLNGNLIDEVLKRIQASDNLNMEEVAYSFTRFYVDDVKAELEDLIEDRQGFQKRWTIFQDILGSRYTNYLNLTSTIDALRQSKLKRAEIELTKILETGWNTHVVISFMLKIAALRGDKRSAVRWMKRLLEEKSKTPRNQMTIIHQLLEYEYYDEAERQIEQAFSIVDNNQVLEIELCKSLLGQKEFDACIKKLRGLRAQHLSADNQALADKMWDQCIRTDMGAGIESDTWVKLPFESIAYPNDPLVSVLVSTYNAEQYIEGCLRDLLSQTIAPQLEIIVIDSNSPTDEQKIVKRYQQQFQNIIYERTEQRESLYKAWNRALVKARAPFVTNANTDDRHRVDALERQAKFLSDHEKIGLVYGNYVSTFVPNLVFGSNNQGRNTQVASYSQDVIYDQCLPGPQPMWRRSIHKKFGLFDPDYRTAGDYEFWVRISDSIAMHHINEYLGIYLYREDSLEHEDSKLRQKEGEMINAKHNHLIESFRNSAIHQPSLSTSYVRHSEMAK
jgi:glycosyltransferase involved in cell wall biosynthesis